MSAYPCPFCGALATTDAGCPGCGRGPDPEAAEVIRLAAEITALRERTDVARQAYEDAAALLLAAQRRRNDLAARVRARVTAQPAPPATRPPSSVGHSAGVRPEASTRTVQTVLFILGGLLLATAAVVFTAVAWATFGVGGRAAILAVVTAAALAAPLLALRRRLVATAETFAVVGLLLVPLDGYAAWYVNLFGVADMSARRYAGVVCAVTALVAAGYGLATRLAGPRFIALLAAQPALPLIVAPADPGPAGWALVWALVAAGNAGLAGARSARAVRWRSALPAVRVASAVVAWALFGVSLLVSAACALVGLVIAGGAAAAARSGGALLLAGLVLLGAAVASRRPTFESAAGAVLVVATAVAAGRLLAVAWPAYTPVLVAAVAAGLAVAVAGVRPLLPARVALGPWVAALGVGAVVALGAVVAAVPVAIESIDAALPPFAADLADIGAWDWQPAVAIALVAAAVAVLVPTAARPDVGFGGAALLVLAAPAAVVLPWWGPAALGALGAAVLAVAAVRGRTVVSSALRAAAALLLGGHALLAGLGRAAGVAGVLAVVVLTGALVAALGRRGAEHQRTLGGVALAVGLLAWPGAVAAGLAALTVEPWWVARATVGATAVLVAVLAAVDRGWPGYRWAAYVAVLVASLLSPLWAVLGSPGEPPEVYAAIGLLLIGAAAAVPGTRTESAVAWAAATVPGVWWAVGVAPAVFAVLVEPYGWLDAIWSGRPAGVGLAPSGEPTVAAVDAVALGLVAVAVAAVAARAGARVAAWAAAPVAGLAGVAGLAAAGARWPAVPAGSLVLGLAGSVAAALWWPARPARAERAPASSATGLVAAVLGTALAWAGLAGALPTEGSTLTALGLMLAAATAAGAAGRTLVARLAGWRAAVTSGVLLAFAAAMATGLDHRPAAYPVLGVAGLALAGGALLRGRRPAESAAIEAAAHAGAVVALLLAIESAGHAAAVCTLWGAAMGVRALVPGEPARRRRWLIAAAAAAEVLAWWLLMVAAQVRLVEAYSVPAAAAAVLAGWLALRGREGLSSWVAFGPGLAAGLLPSLAMVFVGEGHPLRRLLLGLAALAVLLAGVARRWQAPVVLGGGALALVALHELLLVWDLLPRWIPLATAGLLLVGLAMTLERRRRDLSRFREALARMS